MKRWLAILGITVAALGPGTAPAAANGPGDPFSTNCDVLASLALKGDVHALRSLAGLLGLPTSTTLVRLAQPLPVVFISTDNGGCNILVNP